MKKFNYYIDLWIKQKKNLVKNSTFSRYIEIINIYIKPYFGNKRINKIDNNLVIKYISYLKCNNLSNKTIKDICVLLKQIFRYSNITLDVKAPKYNKKEIGILDKNQQKRLENYIFNNLNAYNFGILLSLYTGLRIGELCSLRWKNIDFENKCIMISNTMLRIKNFDDNTSKTKVIINSPKSVNSKRTIPISTQIFDLLLELKKNVDSDNNFLLTNSLKYMEPRSYYYNYKKTMKNLNLEKFNFHCLRHTFATRCIELGFDYKSLSEILGHSDVKITLSFYVHPTQELKISNMEKLKLL